jgi:RluA family pseudouridine synthase
LLGFVCIVNEALQQIIGMSMNFPDDEQDLLKQLDRLKQELIELRSLPEHQQFAEMTAMFLQQWQALQQDHQERKRLRDQQRLTDPNQAIDRQSQQDGTIRRNFKRDRDTALAPLKTIVQNANQRIQAVHQERQQLSQQLQQHLQSIILEPLANPLIRLYEDHGLLAIDKPAGMLSVPGRGGDRQASVLRYLQQTDDWIFPIHRLDQDTSGILLFAKNPETLQVLQQQFAQRRVKKIYEARLEHPLKLISGTIDLPLWGDPTQRPYQMIDLDRGKPSITEYQVLSAPEARIELTPLTGRTHQLRVHMADRQGLNNPILGDRLYGKPSPADRLHLHAKYCSIYHHHQWLTIESQTPF